MKIVKLSLSACMLIAAALPVHLHAADDHAGHDHGTTKKSHRHETKPANGGVVSVVRDVNYELVARPDVISLYIRDHGKAADIKGAKAKLTLLSGKEKSEVMLSPSGDKLEARGSFKVSPGTKAVAQVTMGSGSMASVRFVLK